ncbi:MAG TPA: alpha-glucosidase [Leptospiraceae bacterium]|nr:alpha-glucosidase [Leptospiraceae bacterium]HNI94499.1 alpha-glucosidase [Leptospiraceae bacterium]HNN06081.1 alpha-glucosidase [Leptospiraceae bacterium]
MTGFLLIALLGCTSGRLEMDSKFSKEAIHSEGILQAKIKGNFIHIFGLNKGLGEDRPFMELPLDRPFLEIGRGEPKVKYSMASFSFKDSLINHCAEQKLDQVRGQQNVLVFLGKFSGDSCNASYKLEFKLVAQKKVEISVTLSDKTFNRVTLVYGSDKSEQFFGFGEQYTHFNMKGKTPFIFTEEQGIGRGDQPITFGANLTADAGGNEYTSYAPMPFYISTKNRSVFFENSSYSKFDFSNENLVKVQFWEGNLKGSVWIGETPEELISQFTEKTGRYSELPDWAYGTWMGLQAGEITAPALGEKQLKGYDKINEILNDAKAAGNPVTALWIQDWCGRRITGFGDQLKWRWYADEEMYPKFAEFVKTMNKKNIQVLGYINSFLADRDPKKADEKFENPMLEEAKAKGYLVKNQDGKDYLIQTVGFPAYLIDLTNPEAAKWTKSIIKKNMIDVGLAGWMADFGEWLPFDAKLHSGISAEVYHNQYPVDWARVNREAIAEAGKEGKIVFFTRAGYSYSGKYSTAFWLGDQMVSFGENDGIASTVVGLNSGGISGIALNHSDIGGYTTIDNPLMNYHRSKELFLRWTELNAFTPIFRTHEGNKPKRNHQPYTDDDTVKFFARFGKIHLALKPYLQSLAAEAKKTGMPVVRHPYIHYPNDKNTYNLKHQFLLGKDLLVLPVVKKGADSVEGYFPEGEWTHIFTGKKYPGGKFHDVDAPLGTPAVFAKTGGEWSSKIIEEIGKVK